MSQDNEVIIKSFGKKIFSKEFKDLDELEDIKLPKKLRFKF